jgi:hypothetical protein
MARSKEVRGFEEITRIHAWKLEFRMPTGKRPYLVRGPSPGLTQGVLWGRNSGR